MSTASPSLEDVFERCCDMDASLAERLATFAEAVRTQRPAFSDAVERLVGRLRESGVGEAAPKRQIVTIVLGAAVMLGTATSLFAQTSGLAVGGGAAGGPNGIYMDSHGFNGNSYMTVQMPSGKSVQLRTAKVHGHKVILVPTEMACDAFRVNC